MCIPGIKPVIIPAKIPIPIVIKISISIKSKEIFYLRVLD
jgi:hypothetical protein